MRKSSKPALPSEARVKIAPKKKPTVDLSQGCNPCGASGAPLAPQKFADSGKPPVHPPVAVSDVPASPEGPSVKTEGDAPLSARASGTAPKSAAPHVQASATAKGKEEVGAATGQKQQQCTSGDGGSTRYNADTASVGAAQKQTTSLVQKHAAAVIVAAGVDKEYSSSKGKVNDVAATFSASSPTTTPLSPSTPPPAIIISENGRLVTDRAKCIRREADELMVKTHPPPTTHVGAAAAAVAIFTHSSLYSSQHHPSSCKTIIMRVESDHYSFVALLVNQARHEEGRRQIEKVMDMDRLRQQLAHDEILSAV